VQQGLFDLDYVADLLAQHWDGGRDNRKQIFNLLTFCMWQETLSR